jgi:uncharacterized protein (DUF433 family)
VSVRVAPALPKTLKEHGVERCSGRCGGEPVIEGTRVPTANVMRMFLDGWSLTKIVREFPTLTTKQIENALRFESHRTRASSWAYEFAHKRLARP